MAAEQINAAPLRLFCAGRTDTGVHARQQVVHFDTEAQRPINAWVKGVNSHLPAGIAIMGAREFGEDFHARFSAITRTYRYYFYCASSRDPLKPRMTWIHYPVDLQRMRQAAACLLGTHDFSAFRAAQCQAKSPVRTLYSIELKQHDDYAWFEIHGNAFLHHMVRNLVGVLFEIGLGKKPVDWSREVLESRKRECATRTYPATGLTLWKVEYPAAFEIDTLFATSYEWL